MIGHLLRAKTRYPWQRCGEWRGYFLQGGKLGFFFVSNEREKNCVAWRLESIYSPHLTVVYSLEMGKRFGLISAEQDMPHREQDEEQLRRLCIVLLCRIHVRF